MNKPRQERCAIDKDIQFKGQGARTINIDRLRSLRLSSGIRIFKSRYERGDFQTDQQTASSGLRGVGRRTSNKSDYDVDTLRIMGIMQQIEITMVAPLP